MFINGEWVNSSSGKKIETLNPENNEVWATVPEADKKDVDKAVQLLRRYNKKIILMQCNTNYTGEEKNFNYINLRVRRNNCRYNTYRNSCCC